MRVMRYAVQVEAFDIVTEERTFSHEIGEGVEEEETALIEVRIPRWDDEETGERREDGEFPDWPAGGVPALRELALERSVSDDRKRRVAVWGEQGEEMDWPVVHD